MSDATHGGPGTVAGRSPAGGPPGRDRLCIHTATNRPLPLEVAVDEYVRAGVSGITVWRDALAGRDPAAAGDLIRTAGLEVVSLCRGGFFVSPSGERRAAALEENRAVIREAAALGAPLIVLVCGADPAVPLPEARDQIRAGIESVLPLAEELGVRLAIEPLHPMYADTRSAITDLATANDLAEAIASPLVGVAVDVYHLWFDPRLEAEIARAGAAGRDAGRAGGERSAGGSSAADLDGPGPNGRIFAFHVCDRRTPTRDLLTDRGLMGEGCIDIPRIRGWVERAGFAGMIEVEIFSNEYWATDQRTYIERIVAAYEAHV
ncbi:MAG: sugar phosphate isomerase/epimerase family protein [Spirochaetota bacterium]